MVLCNDYNYFLLYSLIVNIKKIQQRGLTFFHTRIYMHYRYRNLIDDDQTIYNIQHGSS